MIKLKLPGLHMILKHCNTVKKDVKQYTQIPRV